MVKLRSIPNNENYPLLLGRTTTEFADFPPKLCSFAILSPKLSKEMLEIFRNFVPDPSFMEEMCLKYKIDGNIFLLAINLSLEANKLAFLSSAASP